MMQNIILPIREKTTKNVMVWQQVIDPLHNLFLSATASVLPVLFIFWALIIKRMKGYQATLMTTILALLIAVIVYRMPVGLAVLSVLHGGLYGLFPICWITVSALFLFNVIVKSGQFEIIKNFLATISSDRRLQVLLIAFSFGSFLEGTAGFATPVAITAAMLFGMGFDPLYAAGICLIANTAPVAFGSIGIPIVVGSQVSGIPEMALSQMVGRTLPFLSACLPFYLIALMCGIKKSLDIWPAVLVSGFSFAFFQWFSSNYIGPMLPDVIAGIASICSMLLLLKFWKPKETWRFSYEENNILSQKKNIPATDILVALSPFIILTTMVIAWGLQPVKESLNALGFIKFNIPFLHNTIQQADGKGLLSQTFTVNFLSAAGSAIFMAAFISMPLIGVRLKEGIMILFQTLKQLRYPIISIVSILGFTYVTNNSGMSNTLAQTLAKTGVLFPFFAPVLGWLGVFITGSDTSSNALFGQLQFKTAMSIGVDPVVTVAGNCSGGVVAKMISPQSIAVAAGAGGLIGKESNLFRFTVKHSFIMLFIISLIVFAQAYLLRWMTPTYARVIPGKLHGSSYHRLDGNYYILTLGIILTIFIVFIKMLKRKKTIIN
jgi:lactate permease